MSAIGINYRSRIISTFFLTLPKLLPYVKIVRQIGMMDDNRHL
jgi:hypothetical protein